MSEHQQDINNVKIITWNVNGIRSLYKSAAAMKEGLDLLDGDIICLQETKVARCALDEGIAVVDGYNSYYGFTRSKGGYSGVATYCKNAFTPFRAEEGLSGLFASSDVVDSVGCYGNIRAEFSKKELGELDYEGRAVITQHKIKISDAEDKTLTIINVYCPRAELHNVKRLQMKLRFYHLLEIRARAILDSGSFVIILGDINTFHKPIDHCESLYVEEFNKNPCRKWLNHIIYDPSAEENTSNVNVSSFHLIDAFRFVNPVEENAFTCWSTQLNARSTNYGTRLDYILIDLRLGGEMNDCIILRDVQGSDHCPVKAIIDLKFVRAPKCPSFCTKYYPEFAGTQKKISDFFKKKSSDQELGTTTTIDCALNSLSEVSPDSSESVTFEPPSISDPQGVVEKSSPFAIFNEGEVRRKSCCTAPDPEKKAVRDAWRSILTGPKPPPKCKGHREPCIQRSVKKKGPNLNRKFWVCARGEGRSDDESARCDHFQWDSSR